MKQNQTHTHPNIKMCSKTETVRADPLSRNKPQGKHRHSYALTKTLEQSKATDLKISEAEYSLRILNNE